MPQIAAGGELHFVVLDVELCADTPYGEEQAQYAGPKSGVEKYALADVEIVRESDFGQTDDTLSCVTHLGNLLQPGDTVLGYDLVSSVLPSESEPGTTMRVHPGNNFNSATLDST